MGEWSQDILESAENAVTARQKTFTHRKGTFLWYSARNGLKAGKVWVAKRVMTLGLTIIPVVGDAADALVDIAFAKAKEKLLRLKLSKVRTYASINDDSVEALRKAAKADMKEMKTQSAKISSNLVKLKDATIAANTKYAQCFAKSVNGTVGPDDIKSTAMAIHESRRYILKIMSLLVIARDFLDDIDRYLERALANNDEALEDFGTLLDEIEGDLNHTAGPTGVPTSVAAARGYRPLA